MEAFGDTELCFPQLLNTSCVKTKRPHVDTMLTNVVVVSLSLLTVFFNLLVIISVSHFKQLHTSTNILLLSLAVSDFFIGLLLFFRIMFIDGCWLLGDNMCTMYQYLDYVITSTSVGNMVLISLDRYVAICYPLHYSIKVTQKRVKICVSLCWTFSVIFQSLILQDILKQPGRYNSCIGDCNVFISYIAGVADVIFSFILPITVIVVLYTRVFVVAVSQARAMRSHIAAVALQCLTKVTAKKSELKAARTLGIVIAVFLMCFCPFYIVALTGDVKFMNPSHIIFVTMLSYCNASLNPVIYALFYPWFKKSIKLILALRILQPDSCETNLL